LTSLKKIFYGLVIFFAVLMVSAVFMANSSFVIQKAADYFAPDYKISYDDIRGNILTGVTIDGVKFEGKPLAESLRFSWNHSRLLYKRIAVNTLEINALDVDIAKRLIASFRNGEKSSREPFDLTVTVDKVYLSLNPFEEQGVLLSKTVLTVERVKYASNALEIKNFTLLIDSNISQIDITGNLTKDTLSFGHLVLKDIDTYALQKLFAGENNKSDHTESKTVASAEQSEANPLLPKYVVLKSFQANVLPAMYDPVHILNLALDAKNIIVNVEKLLVENGLIELNGTSNLSNFKYNGQIENNHLIGKMKLTPNRALFELYQLPLRKEAMGDIEIGLNVSKEQVIADINAKAKQVLISKNGEFNVDIDSLLSHVVYRIREHTLVAASTVMITTPYAKDIAVINTFKMDDNISYGGEIKAKELIGIDAKFTKPLKNLNIKYTGDIKSIKTVILSDGLKGSFDSLDFKKGQLHLETTKAIVLHNMMRLPAELNGTKVNAVIDAPLNLEKITPLKAKAKITSNVTNLDMDIVYGKILQVKAISNIPQDSLLKKFDENVKWDALDPLIANVELNDKNMTLKLKAKALSADLKYLLSNGQIDGMIKLGGLITDVKGIVKEKVMVNAKVSSIKSLLKSVETFYTLENMPPVEGALNFSMDITEMKQAHLSLTSPEMIYKPDHRTEHIFNDMKMVISFDKSNVFLKEYTVTYDKMKFFSTKPSSVKLKGDTVEIAPLWLNDQLKVAGRYNIKNKQGNISADASALHIAHKLIDLDSAINLETALDGNKTSVKGQVTLLGGDIHYDLRQKTFASDSDIIIVQDMKREKESSPFMDNLTTSIQIKTKKPLLYKQGDVNIQAKADLRIEKTVSTPMLFLGSVELLEGGSYIFQDKKFILKKCFIYFTGNIETPILDIKAEYKTVKYLITVSVTGTPALPNINFSSVPHLTREQILSVILFDSEAGAENNSGEDMMKMMGGAMAKSALSHVGIKIDHLVLGTGSSMEVGKKLTDKITIIYINDEVSSVKLQYDYSKNIEATVTVSPESSSGDIFYKGEF